MCLSTWRPLTVPPTTTGTRAAGLAAVHSCFSEVGTREPGPGTATAAGRLMVARGVAGPLDQRRGHGHYDCDRRGGRDIGLGAALRFNHAVGGSVSPRGEAVLGVRRASVATASRSFAVAGPGAGHNIGPGIRCGGRSPSRWRRRPRLGC